MEVLKLLSRNEMRSIVGGDPECAGNCLTLYGGYYEECLQTFGPSTDERAQCVDEVYELNTACINSCFQVN